MKKKQKRGISLIVLVITIIVMIILAATIVLTLQNNNIIQKSNNAVDKYNSSALKDVLLNQKLESELGGKYLNSSEFLDMLRQKDMLDDNNKLNINGNNNYTFTSSGAIMLNGEIIDEIDISRTKNNVTTVSEETYISNLGNIKITVNDGTISKNEELVNIYTIVANTAPEGKKFGYWEDNYGRVVSFDSTSRIYSYDNVAYAPIYVDEEYNIEKTNVMVCYANNKIGSDKISIALINRVLDEYTIVKRGMLVTTDKSLVDNENFVLENPDVINAVASNITTKNLYMLKARKSTAGNSTYYIKGYLVYTDDLGNEKTEYSDVIKSKIGDSSNFYIVE